MKISFGLVIQTPYIQAKAFLKNPKDPTQKQRTPSFVHSKRNSAFLSLAHI